MARSNLKLSSSNDKIAVLYLRMSSNPQKDSIAQQRRECLRYASDNGYTIVGEYMDEAISGVSSRSKRKGFRDMVKDAQSGKFDFVICWEQNRASRSKPREFIQEMNPLADSGVKLVMTDKGVIDLDSIEGLIQAVFGSHSDNEFILSLSRRVIRGQHAKAMMGLHVAGPVPFGFESAPVIDEKNDIVLNKRGEPLMGRIVLGDDYDVETIRVMFRWYIEGLSFRGINERLKRERKVFKTTKWVQSVLSHPYDVGDYRWNFNSKAKFYSISDGKVTAKSDADPSRTKADDQIIIKNNHPAMVDRETFNRVQAIRGTRQTKTSPFRNGGPHMLTGICWCAKCGSKFSGHTENHGYRVLLKCNGYNNGTCNGNYVRQDEVIGLIIGSIQSWVQGNHIDQLRKSLEKKLNRKTTTVPKVTIKQLNAKKQEYEKCRKKFRDLPDDLIGDFMSDLREMKSEIDLMESDLLESSKPVTDHLIDFDKQADKLLEQVSNLEEAVIQVSSTKPHLVRELISQFANRVILDVRDKGKGRNPRFELKGGEIQLNPAFNLLPASYYTSQVISIPLMLAS